MPSACYGKSASRMHTFRISRYVLLAVASILLVGVGVGVAAFVSRLPQRKSANLVNRPPRTPPDCSPDGIMRLVETFDDDVRMHSQFSPSSLDLKECGLVAIPPMLDILEQDDNDEGTRVRAAGVLYSVIQQYHGIDRDRVISDPVNAEAAERMRHWFDEHGRIYYDAPVNQRRAEIMKWREWLKNENLER